MILSAVIIARNEEGKIKDCIRSLQFADEVIVIDNNSSDDTAGIAKREKARVYKTGGMDFSILRNTGKIKARGDWLFYLDADERISKKLSSDILSAIQKDSDVSAYLIPRHNFFYGHRWPADENMVRLIRKDKLRGWTGKLHESAQVRGRIGSLKGPILHYTHDDIKSMADKTNEWSEIEANLRFADHHPPVAWWRIIRVMLTAFFRSYIVQRGWKAGVFGLVESMYQTFSMFITYAKLWEKQNKLPD